MPNISAELICDSVNPYGDRLSTFVLTYPRFIHSEIMSHRVFSRNAQSSRAIPTARRVEGVRNDPVMPITWLKNQPGMVAKDVLIDDVEQAQQVWRQAAKAAADSAEALAKLGLHKQWTNRLLEPFDTITVVLSGTTFENFFALRTASDAQPEICELALQMQELLRTSTPRKLYVGLWHLPFIDPEEDITLDDAIVKSVAACARVSYLNHDGTDRSLEKDRQLVERLVLSGHWTPLEHQATPTRSQCANYTGWMSRRYVLQDLAHA